MNLANFRTAAANELGLDTSDATELATIDDAANAGVRRVLEDTHCYVKQTQYTSWDGTCEDFTMDANILDIVELTITSSGTIYSLERISVPEIIDRRRVGSPTGSPVMFYAVSGWNLLMFYPAPGGSDTLSVYHVPVPTAMSASGDDPSTVTVAGVPTLLHDAAKYWMFAELASYDDDASSQQGERYRNKYDLEIVRYEKMMRKRGGSRLARARVNDKRRRRTFHTNDIYYSGSS